MKEHFKKYWPWYVGGLLILVTALILFLKSRKQQEDQDEKYVEDPNRVLGYGDKIPEVKTLQALINQAIERLNRGSEIPYNRLVVDGIFGPKTRDALDYVAGVSQISINQMREELKGISVQRFGGQDFQELPTELAAI